MRVGVYICHCGGNISEVVDIKRVASFAEGRDDVVLVRDHEHMCSEPGQKLVADDIKEQDLDRVVVAACSPKFHEDTFRKTLEDAGLNPYVLEMANLREQCSWPHFHEPELATQKAKALVAMAIAKVRLDEPLPKRTIPIGKRVLVIGAGISGIQAALDLGEAGFDVHLVEQSPTVGGKMAQLNRTFPTEDCAACILSPKMAAVPANPNINLLTYSEVEEVSGYISNFTVRLKRKPRYVDMDKCTSCSECINACPVKLISEFEAGLTYRTAIYRPSPIAVPNKFLIDKRGIPPCRYACPAGVNAQAYVSLVAQGKFEEALAIEREDNPFPSVCGRVCTHPCETECKRGELDEAINIRDIKRFIADYEKEAPTPQLAERKEEKVAIIGSGPSGLSCAYQLAKLGYSASVFEKLPVAGGMLAAGIPRFRLPRESLQKDIDHIQSWGVEVKTNQHIGDPEKLLKEGYNAVYIATGAWVERKLRIEGEELEGVHYGIDFLRSVNLGEEVKIGEEVAVIGGGNSAIDAARTALRLGAKNVTVVYRRSRVEMPANEEEIVEAEREGVKIHYLATPVRFIGANGRLSQMECLKMKLGPPDSSGRRRPIPIEGSEFIIQVDTVIPTIGQTPDTSYLPENTGIKIIEKWNSFAVDEETLHTSVPGIFAGGDAVSGPATVIQAISAGKEAAISIDRYLRGVDLKEGRKAELNRVEEVEIPLHLPKVKSEKMACLPIEDRISNFDEVTLGFTEEQVRKEAARCLGCGGCCACRECEKVCEPKAIDHGQKEEEEEINVDTIIVATGYDIFDATEKKVYGYGEFENVISALQMERILAHIAEGDPIRDIGKRIAFIQCVGSRDEQVGREYCSRICCMYATKLSQLLKRSDSRKDVYVFYTDLRAYGKGFEEYYKRAQETGVKFIRGRVAEAIEDPETKKVTLKVEDTLTRQIIESEFDLVVLSVGMEPSEGTKKIAELLRLARTPDGFLQEAHPKFKPVDTLAEGVFICGCAQGPKDIPDSVAQGSAASSRAIRLMNRGEYDLDPMVSCVDDAACDGCAYCIEPCPYDALTLIEYMRDGAIKKTVQTNEVLCHGCGTCMATCPKKGIYVHHFKLEMISAMVEAALQPA